MRLCEVVFVMPLFLGALCQSGCTSSRSISDVEVVLASEVDPPPPPATTSPTPPERLAPSVASAAPTTALPDSASTDKVVTSAPSTMSDLSPAPDVAPSDPPDLMVMATSPAASFMPPMPIAPVGSDLSSGVDIAVAGREAASEGRRLLNAGLHEEALALFQQAIHANPYDFWNWRGHGLALQLLERFDEAIDSYQQAWELGAVGQSHYGVMYNIACCQARQGKKDRAFETLQHVMKTELGTNAELFQTDPDLDSLRDDPRFDQIVPLEAPEGLSRDEGWRFDLDVLEQRINDLYYDVDAATSVAAIEAAIDDLKARVPDLTDDGISMEIQRVLAMLGDGHTGLRSWPRTAGTLPLRFYVYSDGLYVSSARGENADAAGWRVKSIGGEEATDVIARTMPYISRDNRMFIAFTAPSFLSNLTFLRHVGLAEDDDTVRIEFEDGDGRRHTRRIPSVTSSSPDASAPWVSARAGADAPDPLYLQQPRTNYWFEHLPEHDLVYFQYNQILNGPDEPLGQHIKRLFAYLDEHEVGHLAIDLRRNGGGNSYLNPQLMEALIRNDRINRPEGLFVITGRNTFSAAMNLTTDLKFMTNATFVGEPAGSRPNFIGESLSVTLPHSGTRLSLSTRMHQHGMDSTDERMLIAPDYYVPLSSEDFRLNRDPVMDMIRELIKRRRAGAAENRTE